jgi:ATP-dependent exoDNAse (exonuclease V) beta subunit
MTIPRLTVIPAGAGSGKTYRIQTQLAEWVVGGQVAPDRILAVTFTEAAASELKDRIRFELVKRDRIEDALKLEESYISTIHSFGLRVLTEFAFDAGISPSPRLLNDDEQRFLIRRSLAKTNKAEPVAANLRKFGYRWDAATKTGPEDNFLQTLLSLIDRLRSLGRKGEDPELIGAAVAVLRRLYGPTGNADTLNRALHASVLKLLKRFPHDLSSEFAGNGSAVGEFKENFRSLRRAEDPEEIASDWSLWASLQKLRVAAKGGVIPDGYKECAAEVMAAASSLPLHPGPLADAELHVSVLLGASRECLGIYGEEKRKACLVDYPDMPACTHEILSKRPDVLAILKKRVDCLVIDEFQDTNPLQFSLLWKIHEAGVPALIVGDVKQSIMGFQNADPRLFRQIEKKHPEACEPLTSNWRATAPLMEWVNAVGEGLFGKEYTRLTPKAGFKSVLDPLEVVDAPKCFQGNRARASWTAVRIKALLDEKKCKVWDKVSMSSRRLRGGDIAVLCPTNALVETYAEVLRAVGIRTRVRQDGWFGSPAVQIACHALAYVVDASDRHAALYLAVTELGSHTLESALGVLRRADRLEDPVLGLLDPLRAAAADKSVSDLVCDVIGALDLYGKVCVWPDSAQARANLLRLEEEARRFRVANRKVLLAGGYYGGGIKTFLAWLAARAEENDAQPDPRVVDEDAVTVSTWHGAKGLEWPVVAVCGMNRKIEPRFPDVSVAYDDFGDLGEILRKARVEIVPGFAAKETTIRFQQHLQPMLEEEARRQLYVALTRGREKVIVEWPSHLAGKDKETYWTLLTGAADIKLEGEAMLVMGKKFPCVVNIAENHLAPAVEESAGEPVTPLSEFGRRAIERRPLPEGLTPEAVAPSSLHGVPGAGTAPGGALGAPAVASAGPGANRGLIEETIGAPMEIDLAVAGADRGSLLHKCFEVLGGQAGRADLPARAIGRKLDKKVASRLGSAVADFDRWLARRFAPLRVAREVPLLGLDGRGSVVSGVVDLLVETTDGYWVLDHKSDLTDDRAARFEAYLPQLRCYADLVRNAFPGRPVLGVGIHWISYGKVHLLPEVGAP